MVSFRVQSCNSVHPLGLKPAFLANERHSSQIKGADRVFAPLGTWISLKIKAQNKSLIAKSICTQQHEDAFAFYDAAGSHAGTFFFGGLSCVASSTGEYSVVAGFEFQLFGPGSGVINECGDLAEPFGTYNFFDVSAFLSAFSAEQSEADLAAPFGVWNFFDVSAFLGCFTNGGNLGFSSE